MKNRTTSYWVMTAAASALALVTLGCTSSTEPELTLDDLIGRLRIEMSAVSGGNGSSSFFGGNAEASPQASPTEPPILSQVNIPFPGTRQVLSWPEVLQLPIRSNRLGSDIIHSWPTVNWPAFHVIDPKDEHIGNSWMIYFAKGRWHAETTEWLRIPRERSGTAFDPEEKLTAGHPRDQDPVGFFIAGPSRHQKNETRFQRRSSITWVKWGDLSPFTFPGGEGPTPPPPGPGPAPEPAPPSDVLQQVHVYITGISATLQGGTMIDFDKELGDVDLLALPNNPIEVVNAEVPAGTYDHVAFSIDPARSFAVVDGKQIALNVPVSQIRVSGPFIVGSDTPTSITLAMDPDKSLTPNGDGTWTLNLVVVISII